MNNEKKSELNKAVQVGTVCVGAYMVRYYMKNILSVVSPQMQQGDNAFTKGELGILTSAYTVAYAIGQLLNGSIGDIVKPKLMITLGMAICGISSICFSFTAVPIMQILLFALMGFSLSMLRGPLVKTISENTSAKHSRVICTFFSFSSFAGPLIASLISMFFDWKMTFIVAGGIALLICVLVYLVFTVFERKGRITYNLHFSEKKTGAFKNIFKVFTLRGFVFYMLVGALAEISSTSINFWLPTYYTEQLLVSDASAKIIYTVTSFVKSAVPFFTLFLFGLFKEKDIKMIRIMYALAALFFGGTLLTFELTYLNILLLLLAQVSIGVTSSLLWSIYIPSQRESGMVSSVNGVLDFSGYVFASVANIVFSHAIGGLGWNGIIVVWMLLAIGGLVVAVFTKHRDKAG